MVPCWERHLTVKLQASLPSDTGMALAIARAQVIRAQGSQDCAAWGFASLGRHTEDVRCVQVYVAAR